MDITPSQNAPTFGNLFTAAWTAGVLYGATFVDLPGDGPEETVFIAAVVALLIGVPVFVGRLIQKRYTNAKPR